MTQADFAGRIGVSQSYLSAVEHGRNEVVAEVLLAISQEFGTSLEWLLTGGEQWALAECTSALVRAGNRNSGRRESAVTQQICPLVFHK